MSDENEALTPEAADAARKAAAETVERELAEIRRLASKYNLVVLPRGSNAASSERPSEPKLQNDNRASDEADITVGALIAAYKADPRSPYHEIRYRTRLNYDANLKLISEACGPDALLSTLNEPRIDTLYRHWIEGGRTTKGHSLITMLRGLVHFGAKKLENSQCVRISVVLHTMYFPQPKARKVALTAKHAQDIRTKAHEMGWHSIALAQAFQFSFKQLKQRDVIGEWLPLSEPSDAYLTTRRGKWRNGICWEEIDRERMVMRHKLSWTGEIVELQLSKAPMVLEELQHIREWPKSGPIIIRDDTRVPWDDFKFRREWRTIATAAGVPPRVRNADTARKSRSDADDSSAFGEPVQDEMESAAAAGTRH